MNEKVFLPGAGEQIELTLKKLDLDNARILVVGSFSEELAVLFAEKFNSSVNIIVEDTQSFLNTNLIVGSNGRIITSIMNFDLTDFDKSVFDLVYAQASISNDRRNKIVKEINRILKPGGYFSVGEVIKLKNEVPQFVDDIFSGSLLEPLFTDEISKYYTNRRFSVIEEVDLSSTLEEYYVNSADRLYDAVKLLKDNEKSYHKKLLNKVSHETNAYLKLGADKFIGFKYLLLQKGEV
jgi:ubiquinone/menaquinone biosynthesis C-methylase UbiE